jgi:hypothetical protein
MSKEQPRGVMVCRSVADGPPHKGAVEGAACKVCAKPLYISAEGQQQVAYLGHDAIWFFCTNHITLAKETAKRLQGDSRELVMQVNPEAGAAIEQLAGKPLAEIYPDLEKNFDPLDVFRRPKK